MDPDDAGSVASSTGGWPHRLVHPVVLAIGLAVVVGVFAHTLVFIELTGFIPGDFSTVLIASETTHFAWFCTGCGLALMFAAFAMLR